ncbi:patatin-like phospholipase family protein [Nocardioides kribbensis]|uniref:patatin-like phospholipase family protein n=1 Tax=Nocardioides kribbensis TaxID=305517 RepID=UPI0032D9E091
MTTTRHRDVLVLSGGASRGAVQVGMVQALLESGVRPAAYVGTSVGALNATFLGSHDGPDAGEQLARRWRGIDTREVFAVSHGTRRGHLARHPAPLCAADGVARLVRRWAPYVRLEDLPVPVRVVTTRLDSGVAVYHDRGDLLDVLLASTALPGVFDPVRLADPTSGWQVPHVDGGLADLVPVAGARALAPTRVWVLDATVPTRIERVRSPLDALLAGLAESLRVRPAVDLGDIEVHHLTAPDLGVRMHDFRRTEEHIALGRASVAAALAGPADQVEPVAVPAAEDPVTGPTAPVAPQRPEPSVAA